MDAVREHRARPDAELEQRDLLGAVERAIEEALTPHQRDVLVALALNGVPIDVLADRLSNRAPSTRRCTTHAGSCAGTSTTRARVDAPLEEM